MLKNYLNNEEKLIDELGLYAEVKTNVDLKNYNTFRISSVCGVLVIPDSKESLLKVIDTLKKHKKEYVLLGNGSNVIFKNKKTTKAIVLLSSLKEVKFNDSEVYAECGVLLSTLAKSAINKSLKGLEWSIGIPGTVGGSIYGNAGSYGEEISNRLIKVEVLKDGKFIDLNKDELYFSYRDSIFKDNRDMIIISATFKLETGNSEEMLALVKERNLKRKDSQPLEFPSAGSVFRNPENNYAGALIEQAGFKGFIVGDAKVSEKHANFIINNGNATGKDVTDLIDIIKKKIKEEYNIDLVLEHIIIE